MTGNRWRELSAALIDAFAIVGMTMGGVSLPPWWNERPRRTDTLDGLVVPDFPPSDLTQDRSRR